MMIIESNGQELLLIAPSFYGATRPVPPITVKHCIWRLVWHLGALQHASARCVRTLDVQPNLLKLPTAEITEPLRVWMFGNRSRSDWLYNITRQSELSAWLLKEPFSALFLKSTEYTLCRVFYSVIIYIPFVKLWQELCQCFLNKSLIFWQVKIFIKKYKN